MRSRVLRDFQGKTTNVRQQRKVFIKLERFIFQNYYLINPQYFGSVYLRKIPINVSLVNTLTYYHGNLIVIKLFRNVLVVSSIRFKIDNTLYATHL